MQTVSCSGYSRLLPEAGDCISLFQGNTSLKVFVLPTGAYVNYLYFMTYLLSRLLACMYKERVTQKANRHFTGEKLWYNCQISWRFKYENKLSGPHHAPRLSGDHVKDATVLTQCLPAFCVQCLLKCTSIGCYVIRWCAFPLATHQNKVQFPSIILILQQYNIHSRKRLINQGWILGKDVIWLFRKKDRLLVAAHNKEGRQCLLSINNL